jgi:hypothetical protein
VNKPAKQRDPFKSMLNRRDGYRWYALLFGLWIFAEQEETP